MKCKRNFCLGTFQEHLSVAQPSPCTAAEGGNAELKNDVSGAVTEILGSSPPRAPGGLLQTLLSIHNVKLRRA